MIKQIKNINIDYNKIVSVFNEMNMVELLEKHTRQIAVQCRKQSKGELQLLESCQSLFYNWDKYDPKIHTEPPKRDTVLDERLFTETCDIFKDNYIGYIIDKLKTEYGVYRGRFMMLKYKTCLSMHTDLTPRLHIPIITNPDCFMVVDDNVCKLPYGGTYVVDTTLPHTAINAGKKDRVHLVFCVDKDV